ncbi:uncharacterized protein LOC102808718 [Saccoglossus kowalevskii]|uniref:FK506-binding protein 5-like n=1 Tax=Saccoglossus kowalevskii TaxID=10224 RepID=A0ABM0MFC5_SACKO|nr:PREDICTED: FK506-binding protein 5-like [Saccoglossus kowalevskii]
MSDVLRLRELTYKLASVTAERDALRNQQPKLDNITRIIVQLKGDITRYQETLRMKELKLMRMESRFNMLLKERSTQIDLNNDEDSIDAEKAALKCRSETPLFARGRTMTPGTSPVVENLVTELNKTKNALEKQLEGKDIDTFIESSEYERIIDELKQTIATKTKENEELKKTLLTDHNDRSIVIKLQDSLEMVKTLERALYIKHSLVQAMSEHIEKIEKECEKTEEKYTSQIRALKDEKKQEKEKESQQQGNVNRRLRQQNQEMGSHHRMNAFQPHHFEDTTTDNVPYSSCAYGQAHHGYMSNPWGGQHSMLPSEVVVDGPDEKVEASLGSHIARECPRCEREFAAHQREDFEKHVEKCLFTN